MYQEFEEEINNLTHVYLLYIKLTILAEHKQKKSCPGLQLENSPEDKMW